MDRMVVGMEAEEEIGKHLSLSIHPRVCCARKTSGGGEGGREEEEEEEEGKEEEGEVCGY